MCNLKNFGISDPTQVKRNTNVPTPMDLSFAQVVRLNIPNRNNNMTTVEETSAEEQGIGGKCPQHSGI